MAVVVVKIKISILNKNEFTCSLIKLENYKNAEYTYQFCWVLLIQYINIVTCQYRTLPIV
jgi:hypothetical protein